MRFFIKAYAMHEDEVAAIGKEVNSGAIDAPNVHDGMIEGIADAAAIERLAARGIVMQAIAEAPELPGATAAVPGSPSIRGFAPQGRADRGVRGLRAAEPQFWLIDVLAGLTDRVITELNAAGADVVERDPSGSLVVRTTVGAERLAALPFVGNLRRYGAEEALDSPAAAGSRLADRATRSLRTGRESTDSAAPSKGRYEAVCHRSEDINETIRLIEGLGVKDPVGFNRVIKFVADAALIPSIAALPQIASVVMKKPARLLTDHALRLIGVTAAAAPSFPFDGSGELVGVADTGLDTQHPDFAGRVNEAVALGRTGDSSDPDGHGTHVTGTIAGDGAKSRAPGHGNGPGPLRGVAPAARIYFQSVLDQNNGLGGLPDDLSCLFGPAYAAGVRVHNNSWGAYLQSRYDTMAFDVDSFVYDHPDFLPVIAAGNEGSCLPGMQSPRGYVDYPSLGAPATSKNGLTVGASRSDRSSGGLSAMLWADAWPDDFADDPIGSQTVSGNPDALAAFSSRGPCDDMRIKPDLVAPGTDIAATRSKDAPLSHFWGAYPNNRSYAFMGGTSMASPIVAGCALLVRQYYRQQRKYERPSAALIKASVINGTHRLTASDAIADPKGEPNYHQGFGRIDMARTLPDPANPAFELYFADSWDHDPALRFISRTGRRRWEIDLTAAGSLRITVAWTDPPGRALQNQLRLILELRKDGHSTNWVGNQDGSAPLKVPAHDPRALLPGVANVLTRDPHNNVQVIRIDAEPGLYTLALFADGLLQVPQDFALVVTGPADHTQIRES